MKDLQKIADLALQVSIKIKEIHESQIAPLEGLLAAYKEQLAEEMQKHGITRVDGEMGYIKWVDSKSSATLDQVAIAKKLGVANLNEFKIPGKQFSYVKLVANKEEPKAEFNK